ncbi:SAM-dependent methyltransferase [Falsirhodobacter sp. 20TX0035]|uniref:SAM-dependent methyltransferase n=1 Tax=Falsirhodobacter sp. 20TX0035 TaxID=3022019 RepID=UPI00232C31A8|nr:cyclopropane-fatty-acyl-phospholipid synthase family protein [Falsirhodobacter sp. 20TX0035]MDB6452116.1 cyclopropane-fatty-acyl-phospholipid synthase [Falsirhodobacter sp. 20TX0035]
MTGPTSVAGEAALPRYFKRVFDVVRKLDHGHLRIVLPDGRAFDHQGAQPGPDAELHIHDPGVFARLVREGDLGFCEAYMDGEWSTPDLQAFLDLIHMDHEHIYDGFPGQAFLRAYERLRHWMRSNSKTQARRNIEYHYDLGNDFYRMWLDRTMTYSSALFETGEDTLEEAQRRKYAALVDRMNVRPGEHVLEIGCGWGGFAEYAAAERGLRVTGLTISQAQYDFAVKRIAGAGLSDRVTLKLQDYRDEKGRYDGVASIEMFEAVGEAYWPAYFDAVRDALHPGRSAALQIITVSDARFQTYRHEVDFIQRYIFPGGMLPSPTALRREVERAQLRFDGSREFGQSYSRTLRQWYATFNDRWDEIQTMGFDDRFRRMWNFYLAACASTFACGNCDVTQVTVTRA